VYFLTAFRSWFRSIFPSRFYRARFGTVRLFWHPPHPLQNYVFGCKRVARPLVSGGIFWDLTGTNRHPLFFQFAAVLWSSCRSFRRSNGCLLPSRHPPREHPAVFSHLLFTFFCFRRIGFRLFFWRKVLFSGMVPSGWVRVCPPRSGSFFSLRLEPPLPLKGLTSWAFFRFCSSERRVRKFPSTLFEASGDRVFCDSLTLFSEFSSPAAGFSMVPGRRTMVPALLRITTLSLDSDASSLPYPTYVPGLRALVYFSRSTACGTPSCCLCRPLLTVSSAVGVFLSGNRFFHLPPLPDFPPDTMFPFFWLVCHPSTPPKFFLEARRLFAFFSLDPTIPFLVQSVCGDPAGCSVRGQKSPAPDNPPPLRLFRGALSSR